MHEDRPGPRVAHARRLEAWRARVAADGRVADRLSWLRLGLLAAGAALAWASLVQASLARGWLLLPLAAFGAVAVVHDRVIRRQRRAQRAVEHHDLALARVEERWAGRGATGEEFAGPEHAYARDLDIVGQGSLFQRINAARTLPGERTLAGWLCGPAPAGDVRARQQAVAELSARVDLREDLALLGEEVGRGVHPDGLRAWSTAPRQLPAGWPAAAAALLGAAQAAALLGWTVAPAWGPVFLATFAASLGFVGAFRARVLRVLHGAEHSAQELELLGQILARIERESFRAPRLVELRAVFDARRQLPSVSIARLARLVQIEESRDNLIFKPFAALGLAGTQIAFAMERWRATSGDAVGRWLDTVGEIEAFSSLAGFAFDRPDDPFPEIVEDGPAIEAEALGHPLIPDERSVRNDLCLGPRERLLIVSGSNMSGKSTFLRAIGVNAALAFAGAPVRARRMRLSPLAVGACMRLNDSLQEGTSRFYAEIRRLRCIVDMAGGQPPLLFLLDEILHGTNSHDRRIGAESLLRGLVARGAVGLATTHDLALAAIADALGDRAANVHFQDQLKDGRIVFDYRLRPGVVQRSNALALMKAVGIALAADDSPATQDS
jgi:hypothetical protein